MAEGAALELAGVRAGYGPVTVLQGVDLTVPAGQITCLMGRNGTGKSTLLRAIMGLSPPSRGTITLAGTPIHQRPAHEIPQAGIGYVPQGRRLFGPMTVAENLAVGLLARGTPATRDRVLALFPRLAERLRQPARTLSGGEQQMLAIGRALCLEPTVLLLDEPGEGLQPSMVALIAEAVLRLKADGVAVLLVEQRVETALRLADRIAFMGQGVVAVTEAARDLSPGAQPFRDYVGV
jgi:branched-chain amino acid transport system ATP-binding protein